MRARGPIGVVVALVLLGVGGEARAQAPRHRLFFVTATAGLGDCAGTLCSDDEADTGPLLGVGGGFFVRPIPWLAGGAELHYNLMSASDRDRNRHDELAEFALASLAVRGI